MKKIFTSLVLPLSMALLAGSCNKVNSDDLDEDAPFYQRYEVSYDAGANQTYASGAFRVRGPEGAGITFGESTTLKVNGVVASKNTFASLVIPTYSAILTGITDVTFELSKKGGKVITNSVAANSIEPISFPSGMPTHFNRSAGISFNYAGAESSVEVRIEGKNAMNQDTSVTKTFTTSQVTFSSGDLSVFNSNTGDTNIDIYLTRYQSMNVPNSDEGIGGIIDVKYGVHNTFVLNL